MLPPLEVALRQLLKQAPGIEFQMEQQSEVVAAAGAGQLADGAGHLQPEAASTLVVAPDEHHWYVLATQHIREMVDTEVYCAGQQLRIEDVHQIQWSIVDEEYQQVVVAVVDT